MGAKRESESNGSWYHIFKGRIARTVDKPTEFSETRENQNGKQVHEEFFASLTGRITEIRIDPSDKYDDQIVIKLDDGKEVCNLRVSLGSGYAKAFMKIIPNVDLEKEVELITVMEVDGERKKTAILIKQPEGKDVTDKGWVRQYFTREHPNGMPDATKNARGEWDFVEQDVFLEKYFINNIAQQVKALNDGSMLPPSDIIEPEKEKEKPLVTRPTGQTKTYSCYTSPVEEDEGDDVLPF